MNILEGWLEPIQIVSHNLQVTQINLSKQILEL